jgi:hypothetical protein
MCPWNFAENFVDNSLLRLALDACEEDINTANFVNHVICINTCMIRMF